MNWKAETVLRIISAICQIYYVSYSAASLYLGTTLTLPAYCNGDATLLQFMTFIMLYIFLNMMGNFVCIIYKSRLSIVQPKSNTATYSAQQENISSQGHDNYLSLSDSRYEGDANQSHSTNSLHPNEKCVNNNYSSPYYSTVSDKETDNAGPVPSGLIESNGSDSSGIDIIGGWQRCKDCFLLTPPRGKHCPLCKHCVLKRDHHCYFVGHCIGFHNQRFFVCFCLYGGLGGLYSLWLTSQYLRTYYEALQTWGLLAYMGPFALVYWALGYTSGSNVGMVMFWWWSFVTSMMGCCYFFGQIALVIRGQTKWEFLKDKFPYRSTLTDNIHSVFGKLWLICFLVPAPFLGYVGDGANWDHLTSWKNL